MRDPWVAVRDALRECARTPVWARSSGELVEGLDAVQVLASQVACLGLALLREIDGRGIPRSQGAANTTAWLRDRYRLSPGVASRQVSLAAALDGQLALTRAGLAEGSVNAEQAQLIAKTVGTLPVEYRVAGERFLVEQCAQFGPRELGRIATHLLDRVAPEVAEQRAAQQLAREEQRAYESRCLHLTEVHGEARVRVSGWLDRESAAVVRAAIDPLCAPRPAAGHPDPRSADPRGADVRGPDARGAGVLGPDLCGPDARGAGVLGPDLCGPDVHGTGPDDRGAGPDAGVRGPDVRGAGPDVRGAGSGVGGSDPRSPGQRRADALVEVCRLALACGGLPDNGGDRPQLAVTIDFDALREQVATATLDDGTVVSPTTARRLACDARVLPVVLGGAGQVLDVGRERRLFTGPLRRALVLRDRGCGFPGCDRPPRWCEGHHLRSWLDGGPTNLGNGVLLCGYHHRVVHQGQWTVQIAADGLPEFIPPRYLDPEQQPRRNTYHRRE